MKTKAEILKGRYEIDGFVFNEGTPKQLAHKILDLIRSHTRIVLDYGNINTNESWNEQYDITGYISFTKGSYDLKYPILVHNSRSSGGGLILTDCILSIKTSRGKNLIYKN